jgi:hypothetical protein
MNKTTATVVTGVAAASVVAVALIPGGAPPGDVEIEVMPSKLNHLVSYARYEEDVLQWFAFRGQPPWGLMDLDVAEDRGSAVFETESPGVYVWVVILPDRKVKQREIVLGGVPPPPPPELDIEYFRVEPDQIRVGESAQLSWKVDPVEATVTIDGGGVASTGSVRVTPTVTTTYELEATLDNLRESDRVTVEVTNPQPEYWQVMLFHESDDLDNLPLERRELLVGLKFRQELEDAGHKFLGSFDRNSIDGAPSPDMREWWDAVANCRLPCVALAPMSGGEVSTYDLPADAQAFFELLEDLR